LHPTAHIRGKSHENLLRATAERICLRVQTLDVEEGRRGKDGMGTSSKHAPGRFAFGLNASQEARAADLHTNSIVFDLLSQGAGGNIFAHSPAELQVEISSKMSGWKAGLDGYIEATYW